MIDPALLSILANPLHPDRPRLELRGDLLVCPLTGVGFRIEDGIPRLLPEQAIPAEEVARLLSTHG